MQELTTIITSIITFINNVLVPLVFAVAFIVFLFGVFRYYIAGGANAEKRKEGTQMIMYSLIGFAVMLCVWGLVNVIVGTFAFKSNNRPDLPTFGSTTTSVSNPGTVTSPAANPTTQNTSSTQNPSSTLPPVSASQDCRKIGCASGETCSQVNGYCMLDASGADSADLFPGL